MCRCLFHCLLTWTSSDSSFQPLPLSFSEKMLVRKKRCMRRHESNQQWNGSNFCSPNPALQGPTTSAVPPPGVLSFPLAFFCWHCWHIIRVIAACPDWNVCGTGICFWLRRSLYPLRCERSYARNTAEVVRLCFLGHCLCVEEVIGGLLHKLRRPLSQIDSSPGHKCVHWDC